MRLYSFVAAAKLCTSMAAHADSFTQTFTAAGSATQFSGYYYVDTSALHN